MYTIFLWALIVFYRETLHLAWLLIDGITLLIKSWQLLWCKSCRYPDLARWKSPWMHDLIDNPCYLRPLTYHKFPANWPIKIWTWWRHQMETFSVLLAIFAGKSPVTGELPLQRPVTQSFDIFFDLRLNKRLSKWWWGWWLETPSRPLWRHCYDIIAILQVVSWMDISWFYSNFTEFFKCPVQSALDQVRIWCWICNWPLS